MKILVTGGSGYIGSAVVKALASRGHTVHGLTRGVRPESSGIVQRHGGTAVVGTAAALEQVAELRSYDAVVHAAIDEHDKVNTDRQAVETLTRLAREGKVVVYTGGCLSMGNQPGVFSEDTPDEPQPLLAWRTGHEDLVLASGPKAAVVRPGFVFGGNGSHGTDMLESFRASGGKHIEILTGGTFPWIHRDDLAAFYAVLVEGLQAGSVKPARFYAVDGRPSPTRRDVAAAFGRALGGDGTVVIDPTGTSNWAKLLNMTQVHAKADRCRSLGWSPLHGSPTDAVEAKQWASEVEAENVKK